MIGLLGKIQMAGKRNFEVSHMGTYKRTDSASLLKCALDGGDKMRSLLLALFVLVIESTCIAETGQVCVSPVGFEQGEESAVNPEGGSRKYTIQIDDGEIKISLPDKAILFDNLALNEKHWVKIRLDGKLFASFSFTFDKYEASELCLWYNGFYHTWSMWKQKDSKHLCKCQTAS